MTPETPMLQVFVAAAHESDDPGLRSIRAMDIEVGYLVEFTKKHPSGKFMVEELLPGDRAKVKNIVDGKSFDIEAEYLQPVIDYDDLEPHPEHQEAPIPQQ